MSREIKFRVTKSQPDGSKIIIGYESLHEGAWFRSASGQDWENGTYGGSSALQRWQYTGSKDERDEAIYEKDIVRCSHGDVFSVVWSDEDASFLLTKSEPLSQAYLGEHVENGGVVIVGTVCDRAELVT